MGQPDPFLCLAPLSDGKRPSYGTRIREYTIRPGWWPGRVYGSVFAFRSLRRIMSEVVTQLSAFIRTTVLKQPNRVIEPGEALISSGLIDSFSLIDLALFVEDTFGVRIEDTELNAGTFDNLTQLASLIESRKV